MYHGDGSYKTEYEVEISLLDLLDAEREKVNNYNSAVSAYNLAKRNRLKTISYIEDIKKKKDALIDARAKIREHCSDKLGIKTNISDILYDTM